MGLNLETPRLRLRPFTLADAPFALRLLNEPSFHEHIGDKGVRDLDGARAYLEGGPMASYAQHGHGLLAVELKETGGTLGMCGLLKREHLDHPDLGYAFLPEAWGRGYALEAARAVMESAGRTCLFALEATRAVIENAGRACLFALVSPRNGASIRLLEKLGFASIAHPSASEGTAVFRWRAR